MFDRGQFLSVVEFRDFVAVVRGFVLFFFFHFLLAVSFPTPIGFFLFSRTFHAITASGRQDSDNFFDFERGGKEITNINMPSQVLRQRCDVFFYSLLVDC